MNNPKFIKLKTESFIVYKNGKRSVFQGKGQEAQVVSMRGSNFNANSTYALVKIKKSFIEVNLDDCEWIKNGVIPVPKFSAKELKHDFWENF